MARYHWLITITTMAAGLSACTPADENYCRNLGVTGTSEYANCIDYYHKQQTLFNYDREFCDGDADTVYPRTLYDTGRQEPIMSGGISNGYGPMGPYGRPYGPYYGGYTGITTVYVPPNAAHNAQVDALRNRIVGPCMDERGWNSPDSWQAGQHPVRKKPLRSKMKPVLLPWQG